MPATSGEPPFKAARAPMHDGIKINLMAVFTAKQRHCVGTQPRSGAPEEGCKKLLA
jgi:hypothetical protein